MITPEQTIAYARECLDTPFHHQGRVPGRGLDCAGLIVHVMKSYQLPYDDLAGYPRHPYKGMLEKNLDRQSNLKKIPKAEFAPGDVLLMRFRRDPQHLAILSYNNRVVHAYSGVEKVVEHVVDKFWATRVVAVYRIVE